MFSKIFIFAIISVSFKFVLVIDNLLNEAFENTTLFCFFKVTIRGSLGMNTNDLLDILESGMEDDRQGLGNSDLEAINTLIEEDKMDQKLLSWNWLRPSSLL